MNQFITFQKAGKQVQLMFLNSCKAFILFKSRLEVKQ